jgi:hypothetical protein
VFCSPQLCAGCTTIDLKPIEMSWQGELDLMQLPPPPLLLLLPLRN